MVAKRALIVDDSKSARVVLSRMLQKYGIEADAVESAEAAIDYLGNHRPDVIFMDHLMPGMDGFQAVQAIKGNPQTATIPIMMYTSQQGELYVGQARALGAVGVLPKLVKPVDVSKVLYQLHLLPDRRDQTPPAFVEANEAAGAAAVEADPAKTAAGLIPADWHPQLESALRNHDAELRRFVVASLDSFAGRIISDIKNLVVETQASQTLDSLAASERKPPYLWIAAILAALLPGIVLGLFYLRAVENNQRLTAANAQLQQGHEQLKLEIERLAQRPRVEAETPAASMDDAATPVVGRAPAPLVEPVPYGEVPLALGRVDVLRELLARLEAQSFRGQVRAEYFVGKFCLTGNAIEGYALALAELPARKCDLIGNPYDDALGPAQHQSLAFANLASSIRRRTAEALTVEVAPGGDRLAATYPRPADNATAGQWNEIAAQNSRVEFRMIPAP